MRNTYLKIFISAVAFILVAVRLIKPDIKIDSSLLILLGIAALPWLSSLVKSVELPGGFKVEFQESRPAPKTPKDYALKTDKKRGRRKPVSAEGGSVYSSAPPVDSYFDRLTKLSPIETIIAFVVADNLIKSSALGSSIISWVVFLFLAVLTPLFLWRQRVDLFQLLISTIVFVVWVFALGGPFVYLSWYTPTYGALALLLATTLSALFVGPAE